MARKSKRNRLTIGGFSLAALLVREVIEILIAVGLFFLGPILLCFRFSDWVWVLVIGLGCILFLDAELGLIGGKDKLSVFKNQRKFIIFIISSIAGATLMIIQYVVVLIILFPPI
jgi:hypothetical protein